MAQKFVDAYDKNTGKKLPNKVPENFFDLFPNLRKTPKSVASSNTSNTSDKKEK